MRSLHWLFCGLLLAGCARGTAEVVPGSDVNGTILSKAHLSISDHAADSSVRLATFHTVHSFVGPPDGSYPEAGLVRLNGKLYGTTFSGGARNFGSVFEVAPSGAEKIVSSFKGGPDGGGPWAAPIAISGSLYGTTTFGGIDSCKIRFERVGCGTIFKVTPSGAKTVLYKFSGQPDGAYPYSSLTAVNGTLYGTTYYGGTGACRAYQKNVGCGTVFKVTPSGVESVLYSFQNGSDGANPYAGLTENKGTLYGTTEGGGGGFGTVFMITPTGVETVLHSFSNDEGQYPLGGLIQIGGAFFGTAQDGGASSCGTVFRMAASGTVTALYSFKCGSDGYRPEATLTNVAGTLYGTTAGGDYNDAGTVFKVTLSGQETVLHSFGGGTYTANPQSTLVQLGGTLYGTTFSGGSGSCRYFGCGTIFSISL